MFLRALLAFLFLPGVAAFLLPPLLAPLDPWRAGFIPQGGILMVLGLILLLWCVRDFYVRGKGTLAPWDPPQILVVVGLYRFVRNPMYIGVLTLVAGWAVLYASPLLGMYAAALAIGFHLRVVINEEPWLRSQFGEDWERYRASVGRWIPRRTPWRNV
jgi:protein-S-isoprenylcysteine O-methyltransferase Ste14